METKKERYEFRLTNQELTDLREVASRKGISPADLIRAFIRRSARNLRKK